MAYSILFNSKLYRCILVALALALSKPSSAQNKPISNNQCLMLKDPSFREDFFFIANTDDVCLDPLACRLNQKWKGALNIRIWDLAPQPIVNEITSGVEDFVKTFNKHTNNRAKIIKKGEGKHNIIVFIVDQTLLDFLDKKSGPINWEDFNKYFRWQVESGISCPTQVLVSDDDIQAAFVFIPIHLKDKGYKACVLEELYNSTGLFGDHQGAASIFEKYFKPGETDVHYTDEMRLMLRLYYELDEVNNRSLQEYYLRNCE